MKAPLSWLRELTPVDAEPADIARALSSLGLVVEGMDVLGPPLPGIVVARVLGTRPHPAADRIQVVDVDAGDGQPLQICCGAFNMKAGDLVPLATLGTVMPSGMEIARRKMRGEWSNGMLCSAPELGLGPEGPKPGIYLLPNADGDDAAPVVGQPVAEALGLASDVVFDIEVSPNRGDCFSIAGIARDLAAGMRLPFALPQPPHEVDSALPRADVDVAPDASGLCTRFTGTVLGDVASARVPAIVAWRLALCGMRSVNPVVDVSNYVMLELGQPNHPYDLGHLGGGGLRVRRAAQGEELVTLDGATRRLEAGECVIADAAGSLVGLAGIMGGQSAEISGETATVLLEMANFDPAAITAAGKRLGLVSEARTRFERGVDIEVADLAIDRFVQLLGGRVRRGPTTDVRLAPRHRQSVTLRAERANLLLGTSLTAGGCAELLAPLGFDSGPSDELAGTLEVMAPSWRPDCRREADLVEEVARMYGYDNIQRSLPSRPISAAGLSHYQSGRRQVRDAMVGLGASEAWTTTFVAASDISRAGLSPGRALGITNPLDQSQGLLRTSILPGLLSALRSNRLRQANAVSLFEVGNVFCRAGAASGQVIVPGVHESEQLALAATGDGTDATYAVQAWLVLVEALRLDGASLEPAGDNDNDGGAAVTPAASALAVTVAFHPGRRSIAYVAGNPVGVVGEVAPAVLAACGLRGRVAALVVDLAGLLGAPRRGWRARAVSRFPASDLDMAFVVSDDVPTGHMEASVRAAAGDLVESLALFDVWRDASLGEGRRSLAFRARLRAPGRTLTDGEIAAVRDNVAAAVLAEHGAVLRGG